MIDRLVKAIPSQTPVTKLPLEKMDEQKFLAFSLGTEEYAIPLLKVREVIGVGEITSVPYTPTFFKGIMNLRGSIISIIDLRLKFKFTQAEMGPETSVIILDLDPLCLGIIVDQVTSVLSLTTADIQAPPDIEGNIRGSYIMGVARPGSQLVLLLNIEKTLSVEELKSIRKGLQSLKTV